MTRSGIVLLLGLTTAGCVLSPPVRFGVGGGGAAGNIVTRSPQRNRRENSSASLAQFRFAVTPLTMSPKPLRADVSLGWTFDWPDTPDEGFRNGPYLEGVWFASGTTGDKTHQPWRWGPTALAEMHIPARDGEPGYGLGGGVLIEYFGQAHGKMFLGRAAGDLGIGLSIRGGARREDGGTYGYVVASVEVRMPGMAAIGLPAARTR